MNSDPKPKTYRSEKYLNFIRSKPCMIFKCKAEAHHVGLFGKGTGKKVHDNLAVPLSNQAHMNLHSIGEETFWELYDIDIKLEIIKLNTEFLMTL